MATIGWKAIFDEEVTMEISQGSTMDMPLVWKVDGTAVPLVTDGYDARCQVRTAAGGTVWLDLTTTENEYGSVIVLEDGGRITIHVDDSETSQADWNSILRAEGGRWDLELVFPDGEPRRLVMGPVVLSREVTA